MKRIATVAVLLFALAAAPLAVAGENDKYTVTKDVVYGHKMGMALTYDVIQPKEANGAGILFMVSGGWFSRYFDPDGIFDDTTGRSLGFQNIVDTGFTLYLVRHGSAPLFKVPDAVADVKMAVKHIKANADSFGVDVNRLGVFGGSAGGHLSLMLGNDYEDGSKLAAVVAYFPPVDIRGLTGPNDRFPALDFDADKAASISPILFVSEDDPPTLLIHGDQDELVPLNHSERIEKAYKEAGVTTELIVIEGAGHGFRGEHGETANAALVAWFEKHLAK